jgi:hypothetical protein
MTTNGHAQPIADEQGQIFPPFPTIELETSVTVEGYTFRVTFRDTSLAAAMDALKKRNCVPARRPLGRNTPRRIARRRARSTTSR